MLEPAIIEVAENVHTAIGYQVSANTMIVGDNGVIIIDPGQVVAGPRHLWPGSQLVRRRSLSTGSRRVSVKLAPLPGGSG